MSPEFETRAIANFWTHTHRYVVTEFWHQEIWANWVWIGQTQDVRQGGKQEKRRACIWVVNSKPEIWRWTLIAITFGDWGSAVSCARYVPDIHWAQYYCQSGWLAFGWTHYPSCEHCGEFSWNVQVQWWCSITQNNNELHLAQWCLMHCPMILRPAVCAQCPDVDQRKNSCSSISPLLFNPLLILLWWLWSAKIMFFPPDVERGKKSSWCCRDVVASIPLSLGPY